MFHISTGHIRYPYLLQRPFFWGTLEDILEVSPPTSQASQLPPPTLDSTHHYHLPHRTLSCWKLNPCIWTASFEHTEDIWDYMDVF